MEYTTEQLQKLEVNGTPDDFAEFIMLWAIEKGWWDDDRTEGDYAALAHSEITEAYECFRDSMPLVYVDQETDKPEGAAVEYADCLIRIFHWFIHHGISINEVLALKMKYNMSRSYRHGGKQT